MGKTKKSDKLRSKGYYLTKKTIYLQNVSKTAHEYKVLFSKQTSINVSYGSQNEFLSSKNFCFRSAAG